MAGFGALSASGSGELALARVTELVTGWLVVMMLQVSGFSRWVWSMGYHRSDLVDETVHVILRVLNLGSPSVMLDR